MVRLKVACLQTNPAHGDPTASMRAADLELARLSSVDGIHILLLPEMAFSGYCFESTDDIRRVVEHDDGATAAWCAKHAIRLKCTVLCGYPRVVDADSRKQKQNMFNALCVVGPDGNTIATYHKTFLYVVDKTWADEGDGFLSVDIPIDVVGTKGKGTAGDASNSSALDSESKKPKNQKQLIRATLGICMDINPREFTAPWDDYELANAVVNHKSSLLLFASAWTNNHPDDDPSSVTPVDRIEVVTYWLNRLFPLIGKDVHFVCANRIGEENGIMFTGCSCVLELRKPRLVGSLGPGDVGVLVEEIEMRDEDVFFGDDEEAKTAFNRL